MKKLSIAIILVLSFSISHAQITKLKLQASGLTCSMCNLSIKKSLEKITFIKSIEPNVEESSYILTLKENVPANLSEIKEAVIKAGFSVAKLEFTLAQSYLSTINKQRFNLFGIDFNIINDNAGNNYGDTFFITDKDYLTPKEYKKYKSKNVKSSSTIINVLSI